MTYIYIYEKENYILYKLMMLCIDIVVFLILLLMFSMWYCCIFIFISGIIYSSKYFIVGFFG